jgi:hypothetical protein
MQDFFSRAACARARADVCYVLSRVSFCARADAAASLCYRQYLFV